MTKTLFINHAIPMAKVRVITLKDNAEQTFKVLQKIGVLHIEEAKELKPVDRELIENARKEVAELIKFTDTVLSFVPEDKKTIAGADFDVIYTRPFKEIADEVKLLYTKASSISERVAKVDVEIKKLDEFKKYLGPLTAGSNFRVSDINYDGEYLVARVFVISADSFGSVEERLKKFIFEARTAMVGTEIVCHAVGETRNIKAIETIVTDAGGRFILVPDAKGSVAEFLEANDKQIAELQTKMNELKADLEAKVGQDVPRIILLREALLAESERLDVLGKAAEAKYITLIEGWVPKTEVEKLTAEVKQSIDYAYVDARDPADAEQPPTKQDNFSFVDPFSLIVGLFGTPKYREWDPTPIVSYSFAFFFGIMTADVMYAIGIALFAKYVIPKFVDNPDSPSIKLFQRVLYTSAIVSGIIGALSGSWFADFFPTVLGINMPSFGPVAQVMGTPLLFIVAAAAIGFVHVNIAHAYAFIQGIQSRNKGVIVAKLGFFAMQIFAILWALAALSVAPALAGMGGIFLYGIYGSLATLIAGIILQMGAFGAIMWIFEITGLVGDILSYTRLAGVGMAGFYLGAAMNLLSNILRTLIPGPIGLVVGIGLAVGTLVIGHVVNIVLSIQGGFVHSMRLCLVEFMFKFYEGGGTKYNPFSLKTTRSLIIKQKA